MSKRSSAPGEDPDFANYFHFPTTFGQERLWFLGQLDPTWDVSYHLHAVVQLAGYFDLVLLQRAFDNVVGQQESLRTGLAVVNGGLRQIVLPMTSITIPTVDCEELCGSGREHELNDLMVQEVRRPFVLDKPPLMRMVLYRKAADAHLLLIVMHHLIADGLSINIMCREVATEYSVLAAGGASQVAAPVVQYGDYAVWQREHITRESMQGQLEYWRRHLADVPVLEIPTDLSRPAHRSGRGGICRSKLKPELVSALAELCEKYQVTQFMELLAGFEVLLSRYSGQLDFAVGTADANRRAGEIENVVGFFANTLAIRADLTGDPTFAEVLSRCRRACLNAYENRDVPFEWLVEELRPVRDLGRSPLFQVMLVLHEGLGGLGISGLTANVIDQLDSGTAKFDLFLSVIQERHELSLALEFNADIFDMRTARLLLAYYEQILAELGRFPDKKIANLRLTVPEGYSLPITEALPEADALAADRPVHEVIAAQARTSPDAIAVSDETTSLSYRQLLERVSDVAARLRAEGVGGGDTVAVCLPRTTDLLACLLAVGTSGAAYLPIDPGLPTARRSYMMEDACVRAVITSSTLASEFALADTVVILDAAAPEPLPPPSSDVGQHPACAAPSQDSLAYVLYTSGSTGKPKGVEVSHRNLADQLSAMRATFGFTAAEVLIAVTNVSFDIAALELFLPLMCGGHVVIASAQQVADGVRLASIIGDSGATVLQATPATWRLLLAAGWRPPASFRILCGGEALDSGLARRLTDTGAQVWNLYGPTEATIWASAGVVGDPLRVRLGSPLPGTSRYLLDENLDPVPLGACGELYLGGRCVAVGYHDAAPLTAGRFLPDPFVGSPGARMYRTGDLCRFTAAGDLQFIGRKDEQVKIRGYRIDMCEIEASLADEPGVDQVAVVPRYRSADDVRLAAFVVRDVPDQSRADSDPATNAVIAERLRLRAVRELPPYAVPATFSVLGKLPLTSSGKVDRQALESIAIESLDQGTTAVPQTETENIVARAFAEVLGVRSVGRFSSFFELGGHSLLAPLLIGAIDKKTGLAVPIRALFEEPTVEGLAARVDALRATENAEHDVTQIRGQVAQFSDAFVDDLLRQLIADQSAAGDDGGHGGSR